MKSAGPTQGRQVEQLVCSAGAGGWEGGLPSLRIATDKLLVVGIGGSTRRGSSTERALGIALQACTAGGAATLCLGGDFLAALPHYAGRRPVTEIQQGLRDVLRQADAVILASPCYQGGVSGLLQNAIDTLGDPLDHPRVGHLDGRPAGCIVTSRGWQDGSAALLNLRSAAHALQAWPTPYGAIVNTLEPADAAAALARVGRQVVELASAFRAARAMVAADAALTAARRRAL